jgi:hypothetical protein
MTGTIRERSPGHFELRAYNAATGKQVTRTYSHPRKERGVGIAEAKKRLARLVSEVAEGKFTPAPGPRRWRPLSTLLNEWIAHGETRGRSPNTLHGYRTKAARIKASLARDGAHSATARMAPTPCHCPWAPASADVLPPSSDAPRFRGDRPWIGSMVRDSVGMAVSRDFCPLTSWLLHGWARAAWIARAPPRFFSGVGEILGLTAQTCHEIL